MLRFWSSRAVLFLLTLPSAWPAWADEAAGPATALPTEGWAARALQMVPYALMFVVMYMLILRPESKQRRAQQQMLAGLQKNDEVLTQSGFVARIAHIEERLVTLELADKVKVRMLKERIVGPYTPAASLQQAKGKQ